MATKDRYIERAKKYESDASSERMKRFRGVSSYKKLVDAYENAGESWKDAGEFAKAERAYEMALRYSPEEDKGRIKGKLKNLGLEKTRTLSFLTGLKKGLEKKFVFAFLSLITLIPALLFVSFSLTGNIILGLTETNSRWIGICLFVCGLIFALLYSRKKK
ncbi:hypothetical protein A3K82_01165 [Candidatus Pacearchaeota archaeon RBG_19FT_COMBO_34_9]|nr:MAG: hypothetical protein A3K82_01165 [Candidatus Pacearchaeota archaeon RBG_19FT_COMBO_34_9]OGJ16502.1 MAG: hypothetical protein A3K74_00110 [Candidatus Pacearchaeota archaeon RBG_13_33_26]